MKAKASRGEIIEVEPGKRYTIRVSIGSGTSRRRPQRTVHGTRTDAKRALTRLLADLDDTGAAPRSRLTVARLVLDHAETSRSSWSAKHYQEVLTILRNYIEPHIGHIRAIDLAPEHVRTWLHRLEQRTSGRSGRPLSASTRSAAYRVAHAAFEAAVRLEILSRNPLRPVRAPRVQSQAPPTLTAEALRAIEAAAEGSVLYIPIAIAIRTGMRRGEILALQWRDVELSGSAPHIRVRAALVDITGAGVTRKDNKTSQPRRVHIDGATRQILATWRRRQAAAMGEYRLKAGAAQWVCSHDDGRPMLPNYLTREFQRLVRRLGIAGAGISFKTLRASHETLLADAGFDRYQLGRRLGHSPRVAERHYIGDLPETDRRAADTFVQILATGSDSRACGSFVEVSDLSSDPDSDPV